MRVIERRIARLEAQAELAVARRGSAIPEWLQALSDAELAELDAQHVAEREARDDATRGTIAYKRALRHADQLRRARDLERLSDAELLAVLDHLLTAEPELEPDDVPGLAPARPLPDDDTLAHRIANPPRKPDVIWIPEQLRPRRR